MKKIILFVLIALISSTYAIEKPEVKIFYKNRKLSQQVLVKVDSVLMNYEDSYDVNHFNIEDNQNLEIITSLGLPQTHFPFAIVIDGRFSAEISGNSVAFVHFPKFMQGIGRHEGNWSINDLLQVLENIDLLVDENVLPELNESNFTSDCEDE